MQYENQYRRAIMRESIVIYQVNLSKDLIEEEFSQYLKDEKEVRVMSAVNMQTPCSYNEYCRRWSRRVEEESMSAFLRLDTCEKLIHIYERGVTTTSVEYRTIDLQEREICVCKTVQMFPDEDTEDILAIVCLKDITEQREKEKYAREMKKKATMDLLTGLLNHVSGELMIRERLLSRQEKEYALFIFDIDNFKTINDTYGHQFGDKMLKHTAKVLLSVCRMKDVAVRMGGDEFALFMELPEELEQVAARIEKSLCFTYDGCKHMVSMGVSTTKECGREYEKLFYCADQAMYVAKNAGRAQYKVYTEKCVYEKNSQKNTLCLGDLLQREDMFQAVQETIQTFSEHTNGYLYLYDIPGDRFYISDRAIKEFSFPDGMLTHIKESYTQFVYCEDRQELYEKMKAVIQNKDDEYSFCCRWISRSRQPVWINNKGKLITQSSGQPSFLIGSVNEIGTRQIADNVSGLLGEASFEVHYEEKLKERGKGFILRIGIDEFREINEQFGRQYGDFILRSVVVSMKKAITEKQKLYRMIGDEFVVIDYESTKLRDAQRLYQRIRKSVDDLITQINYEVIFTISGGILLAKDYQGCSYTLAMKKSQFAIGRAKAAGRNQSYFFRNEEYQQAIKRNLILQEMRKSIINKFVGFEIVYQPIVDAKTEKAFCVEALLRYTKENGERISPDAFISVLEESGLIIPVGRWLIETCARICQEGRAIDPNFRISVNVSPVQLQKSSLYLDLRDTLERYGLPYDAIVLELTESQFLDNNYEVRAIWEKMRENGFQVVVDDFGTGYSNFSNISVINPHIIKLDMNFTARAMKSAFDYKLMKSMIELAHDIGVRVCVEGIETEEYAAQIGELNPDLLQGYYYGYPVEFGKILALLENEN